MNRELRSQRVDVERQANDSPICVLVTTFNRRNTTRQFLKSLVSQLERFDLPATIVLVDDASSDGTAEMVADEFPQIVLLHGTGHLYWAGAVHLAINHLGIKLYDFRGILLINDDIVLVEESITSIVNLAEKHGGVVGGMVVTYSGEIESSGSSLGWICKPRPKLKVANGETQFCDLLPGHIMYIPMFIYQKLGGFDNNLLYTFIDLEFSLRAKRSGFPVLLAPKISAITEVVHDYYRDTSSMRGTLSELLRRILFHPKGPHWRESVYYLRKVSPLIWWVWLPFFYRAFFVAVFRSYYERLPFVKKSGTNVTLEK